MWQNLMQRKCLVVVFLFLTVSVPAAYHIKSNMLKIDLIPGVSTPVLHDLLFKEEE